MARKLDPLEPRLDVLRPRIWIGVLATSLKPPKLLEAVLERNPLYVPALVRLAEIRWGTGRHAESVALGEQAISLDPGNDFAW